LIKKLIKNYAKRDDRILDMGTGSGILAEEARKHSDHVTASDVNPEAKNALISDLFENIEGKFDLIIFNPPYLPKEEKDPDIALDGGPEGHEIIERFLREAKNHLTRKGRILLLFSSRTNKRKIDFILKSLDYDFKEIAKEKYFFEELYVYIIEKLKK
jgi:release factor glutamine methyltransferase